MKDEAFAERCRQIRMILSGVDGVLTDGTVLMLPDGGEAKAFHIRDGLAFVLAQRAGLRTGLLSGRASATVERRAAELGIGLVRQGVRDKRAALAEILAAEGLTSAQVAYIGDDVNDLPVLTEAGLSAAPADAPLEVRNQCFMVTDAAAGRGCLREFVEAILRARGDWERLLAGMGVASL